MSNPQNTGIPSRELPFPNGFAVSWAGAHPFQDGYCLGSEEGFLQFFDADFEPRGESIRCAGSSEAINSVVGCGQWIVASTRREVTCFSEDLHEGKRLIIKAALGAHSLAVLSNGYLVAALGQKGLMFARPDSKPEDSFIVAGAVPGAQLNVYRVAAIPNAGFVCAARSGGILFGRWEQAGPTMKTHGFPGFDAVDICSIGTAQYPCAAAAAKDGTLVLSKNFFHDPSPRTMKFESVNGVVYRVISCQGHLFILTSNALYGLCGVAGQFLDGTLNANDGSHLLRLPMTAVDMNLVRNQLVIVELDQVRIIDIEIIRKNIPSEKTEKPQEYSLPSMQKQWNSCTRGCGDLVTACQ